MIRVQAVDSGCLIGRYVLDHHYHDARTYIVKTYVVGRSSSGSNVFYHDVNGVDIGSIKDLLCRDEVVRLICSEKGYPADVVLHELSLIDGFTKSDRSVGYDEILDIYRMERTLVFRPATIFEMSETIEINNADETETVNVVDWSAIQFPTNEKS